MLFIIHCFLFFFWFVSLICKRKSEHANLNPYHLSTPIHLPFTRKACYNSFLQAKVAESIYLFPFSSSPPLSAPLSACVLLCPSLSTLSGRVSISPRCVRRGRHHRLRAAPSGRPPRRRRHTRPRPDPTQGHEGQDQNDIRHRVCFPSDHLTPLSGRSVSCFLCCCCCCCCCCWLFALSSQRTVSSSFCWCLFLLFSSVRNNCRSLVLGAFGCGAFGCPPSIGSVRSLAPSFPFSSFFCLVIS